MPHPLRSLRNRLTLIFALIVAGAIGSMYVWLSPLGGTVADGPVQISLRVNNLFNAAYATPGGPEHLQPSIEQDRRNVSAELRYRF